MSLRFIVLLKISFLLCAFRCAAMQDGLSLGPIYDSFPLTIDSGHRVEALGPLFYHQQKETQRTWAAPPIFSYTLDEDVDYEEFDFAYPLLSYDRFGAEYRFHFFQVFSFAGGQTQVEKDARRFTLFPIYFQQRSEIPELNYTALLPFYGTLKNRLFRDEIHFVLMPIYVKTRKKDVITSNYVYPFFHLRHGNALEGWQFWPIAGHEHKEPTQRTNSLDEIEVVGGHDKFFAPWLLYMKQTTGIGTTNETKQVSFLPFYTTTRSPLRDSETYLWPLGFTRTVDREKNYKEFGAPWPLVVFARGEGKHVSRVWPIYSRASNTNLESAFYMWPVYKYNRVHSEQFERERTRILFFLYSDTVQKNPQTGDFLRRSDFWPFYTKRRDLDGNERLQVFSILEPLLPNSKSIERNYSQLWSVWRSEKNAKTGAKSQSLLWNLYRRDSRDGASKSSYFFGLAQHKRDENGSSWRWFYWPEKQK